MRDFRKRVRRGLSEAVLRAPGWISGRGWDSLVVEWLLRSVQAHPNDRTEPGVLCLDRQNFTRDIGELRARTRLNWHALRHKLLGIVQMPWTPERAQRQMYYWGEGGEDIARARDRAAGIFERFLAGAKQRFGVDAVLSANCDYWQDEAMRMAGRNLGIPFLVLSREHYITSAKMAERVRRYRESGFRFTGTAVAVFGPATRATMLDAGVCDPGRVVLTGAPRLDAWRGNPAASGEGVLLFSFCRVQYGAPECAGETLEVLNALGREGMRVTVKCKNEEDRGLVLARLGGKADGARLTLGHPVESLIQGARVVVGYNSLAILEALLSGAEVVVPSWGDAALRPAERMLDPDNPACRGVVHFAESPDALAQMVRKLAGRVAGPAGRERRMELFRQYCHYPADTTCSEEVEAFVRRFARP